MKAATLRILNQAEKERAVAERAAYAAGDADLWTFKRVKEVLVEAERRNRATTPRVGPRRDPAAWPEYVRDVADDDRRQKGFERWMTADRLQEVMEGWTDDHGTKHQQWLAGPLLAYPDLRQKLVEWIRAVLADESSKALCERKGWSLATFKRHRDRAAYLIADRLNRAGVEPW